MPPCLRDDEADRLAEEVKTLAAAATKTEAVKIALPNENARPKRRRPLPERLDVAKATARSVGPADPSVDAKPVVDELRDEA